MAGDKNKAFEKAYVKLNAEQKKAVDQIDGPVMVVAGPGTGKTQLLSVRAGNILRRDPTMLPSNILCLTFTDAAATNMRERLIGLIGRDAYKVAIHTFNSFGSWIMTTYPEYFFEWREAETADELTTYRIIEEILEKLPGNHPLAGMSFDGMFFAIKQLQHFISDCKRSNLRPADVRKVLEANQSVYNKLTPIVNKHWPPIARGREAVSKILDCVQAIEKAAKKARPIADITSVETLLLQELHAAATESAELPAASQSKPFTAWKNNWLELDEQKQFVFKAAKHHEKLMAATEIYESYQATLTDRGFVDFNDQIMTVLGVLNEHAELRYNLQERFQYVMIDEYQDTNRSQLELARCISDAPVNEGRPNILVVGDDDQAIYRFQGADMNNIGAFQNAYRDPEIIKLAENYRSVQPILSAARTISTQIELSLEKQMGLSKKLNINVVQAGAGPKLNDFVSEAEQNAWIANEIKQIVSKQSVTVLARERAQLDSLVPYLRQLQVPMDYERRENVLEQEHVVVLLTLGRLVDALASQRLADANTMLPEVLSHPMWGIEPKDIWLVARTAFAQKAMWLDVINLQENTRLRDIADFLISLSQQANRLPIELLLDALMGITEPNEVETEKDDHIDARPVRLVTDFVSPFKSYYFGEELFQQQPAGYLNLLSNLSSLRRHLRAHQQGGTGLLFLKDLIAFIDAYQRAGLVMIDTSPHRETKNAVQLMTVHKSKGLEFDTVFLIGLQDNVWGRVKGGNSRFSYPRNLAEIKPSDNVADDALRLLFVAMTRAKQTLYINYFNTSEDGLAEQPFAPLLMFNLKTDTPHAKPNTTALVEQYEQRWLRLHSSVAHGDKFAILADQLESYRLSITHLNNFLDVSNGGPLYFLTQNFLRFPTSMSASAAYGIAVHETLRRAHETVALKTPPDIDQLLKYFKKQLQSKGLTGRDFAHFSDRGEKHLRLYLQSNLLSFTRSQQVEVAFDGQGVLVGDARLNGTLDLIDFDNAQHKIMISDYKTGKPFSKWTVPNSAPEFERIKLHRYRRQLLFYKLLIDGANDWGAQGWQAASGVLKFVEPDNYGKLRTLEIAYDQKEIEVLKSLIGVVWDKVMALDFPDTSRKYDPTLEGIKQFERDLLDGRI